MLGYLKSLPPRRNMTWFDRLPEELQQELIKVRDAHKAGRLPVPLFTAAKSLCAQYELGVGRQGLVSFLRGEGGYAQV